MLKKKNIASDARVDVLFEVKISALSLLLWTQFITASFLHQHNTIFCCLLSCHHSGIAEIELYFLISTLFIYGYSCFPSDCYSWMSVL